MDYTKQTTIFWENVNKAKKTKRLTWQDISDSCGHSAASISTMSNMNKMPSLGFAMSIAKAVDMPIGSLWPETDANTDLTERETISSIDSTSTPCNVKLSKENLKTAHDVLSVLLYALDKGALDKN